MRKIIILLLLSFVFSMGELFKTWDPSVNTGDVYHNKYEVVPFKIDGVELKGRCDIISLPDEKVLIYKYADDEANKRFKETALVFDFNNKSSKYLYRDKVVVDGVFYNSIILSNGKVLIPRAYNYSIELRLPRKTFLEVFNPKIEDVEHRVTIDGWIVILGEIAPGKVLLDNYQVFDVNTQKFSSYDIRFKQGEEHKQHYSPLYFDGELYLYSRGTRFTIEDSPSISYYKNDIYKKNKNTGMYEKVSTRNYIQDAKIMISNDILAEFGYSGSLFSITQDRSISGISIGAEHAMHVKRDNLTDEDLVLLDDGNILVTSGYGGLVMDGGYKNVYQDSMELYVVSEDRFVLFKTPQKNGGRKSAKLSNGDVLIYDRTDADLFRRK